MAFVSFAGVPSTSEDAEGLETIEFLRDRLNFFGRTGALLACAFLVLDLLPGLAFSAWRTSTWPVAPYWGPVGGTAFAFVLLAFLSRRTVQNARLLRTADATCTSLACIMQGVAIMADPVADGSEAWGVFSATLILMGRAVLVPSSGRRTLWLGSATSILLAASVWYTLAHLSNPADPNRAIDAAVTSTIFLLLALAVEVAASQVIYGLRRGARLAQRLGRYTLEIKIGEGGMGEVYRARHALLRRPTALKLLKRAGGGPAAARFDREVQLAARLCHPNAVTVFDYGRADDGTLYYAMELIDGMDLQRLVDSCGPLPGPRVVRIMYQVCGALAAAHGLGLVHRDIKPANVLVSVRGAIADFVTVVDFGLAKEIDRGEFALTGEHSVIGTPAYMAPEALLDPHSVDGRSDLYSLGCVAYFLLTGQPPFVGRTVVEVCDGHLNRKPVPLSELVDNTNPSLEALILQCLSKKPEDRPHTAVNLAEALAELPSWSDRDAKRWWDTHAVDPIPKSSGVVSESLLVDLQKRGTG